MPYVGSSSVDTARRKPDWFQDLIVFDLELNLVCRALTFPRTVSATKTFSEEPKQPFLGNLATHLRQKHPDSKELAAAAEARTSQPGATHGISAASAKLMDNYLLEGSLNPLLDPTQKGFYKVFAAWILEDDLAFTTGESEGLKRLFKYMQSRFKLPSDTTVRNTIAIIFAGLHNKVKAELKVNCIFSLINLQRSLTSSTTRLYRQR